MCDACFTGRYPIEVPDEMPKDKYDQENKGVSPKQSDIAAVAV